MEQNYRKLMLLLLPKNPPTTHELKEEHYRRGVDKGMESSDFDDSLWEIYPTEFLEIFLKASTGYLKLL